MSTVPEEGQVNGFYYGSMVGPRQRWQVDFQSDTDYDALHPTRSKPGAPANAVSSEVVGMHWVKGQFVPIRDEHMPVLDLDFPCMLIPSTNPDHYHLYLNKRMSWRKYRLLLRVMVYCGLIEKGYYKASVRRKGTFLRMPGVKKKIKPGETRKLLSGRKVQADDY